MNPKFDAILQAMKATHDKKSNDYAEDDNPYSNFETAAKAAGTTVDVVFRVMIGIKLARLNELEGKGKTANFESLEDTRRDLATYGALYASYYYKEKGTKMGWLVP